MNTADELLTLARSQGFSVETTSGGHTKVTNPMTGEFTFMGTTPTMNGHALANTKRDLQRIGLKSKAEIRRERREKSRDERIKRAEELARHVTAPEVVTRRSEPCVMEQVELKREVKLMKHCPRCGETKAVTKFNKRARSKDGLQTWCRDCQRAIYKVKTTPPTTPPTPPAAPAPASVQHFAIVSEATDYKFTNQSVHTDDGCPQVRSSLRGGGDYCRRLDLSDDVLSVVRWQECKKCVERRSKYAFAVTLTADECDAFTDLLVASLDALPEHAAIAEKVMRAVDRRKPLNEVS